MLALLPLLLNLAPGLIGALAGDKVGDLAAKAVGVAKAITGADTEDAAVTVLNADRGKAAELAMALQKMALDAKAAQEAQETERLKTILGDVSSARARDIALQAGSKRNVRADVMVGLTIVGIVASLGFLMSGGFSPGSSVEGVVIGLVGLLSGCFKDAFQFEFGSSRGSAEKSAASERITTAVLDQRQQQAPAAIINQPSGTVNTGSTTDDLNDASLRAAKDERAR